MRVSDFMALALGHPEYGYYMTRDPMGRAGDFTTAPEVSQMYGELIGLWCILVWQQTGKPDPINLVELGPGRGTLMADALRAAQGAPEFVKAARLYLVETSPLLRSHQAETIGNMSLTPNWVGHVGDLPDGEALFIASEFFDALPVRQLVRTKSGWGERMIDSDGNEFGFVTGPADRVYDLLVPEPLRQAYTGDIFEFSPAAISTMSVVADNIAHHGGGALVLDYGHISSGLGDTLQAVRAHTYVDLLNAPGAADITAHVDFARLVRVAQGAGADTHGPIAQADFLRAVGIESRAESLRLKATTDQAADIDSALHRLLDIQEMGQLFKVLAVTGPRQAAPPGF